MKLSAYLIERDGPSRTGNVRLDGPELVRIAAVVCISPRHLYQIATGTRIASWRTATLIGRETGDKVPFAEIRPSHKPVAKKGVAAMK